MPAAQTTRARRWLWTILAAAVSTLALSGQVDTLGEQYADAAFKRALVTFAVARTLNGVISVAQGTEVAVEPGGVGVNFTVGQVLDPINDLVERFSAVMLVATSSLGLQNVLLEITAWWGVNLGLLVAGAAVLLVVWWPRPVNEKLEDLVLRLLLVMVFVRFVVPLFIIGANLIFNTFLAAEQEAASQALEATRLEIEQIREERNPSAPVPEEQSLVDRLESLLDESVEAMNVGERIERLQERVSKASEHIINLIVIFVLQTIILPLFFVWLFAELLKSLASRTARL